MRQSAGQKKKKTQAWVPLNFFSFKLSCHSSIFLFFILLLAQENLAKVKEELKHNNLYN